MAATRVKPRDKGLTHGRALALERMLKEDAILYPQYRDHNGRNVILAKAANKPFSFERSDTAYTKTLDFLPTLYWNVKPLEVDGKTIVWNQLVSNGDFSSGDTGWTANSANGTFAAADGVGTLTCTVGGARAGCRVSTGTYKSVAGRKLYVRIKCNVSAIHDVYFGDGAGIEFFNHTSGRIKFTPAATNTWYTVDGIITRYSVDASNNTTFKVFFSYANVGDTLQLKNCVCIDLTAMFGAGNEPSVEQCRKMLPEPYYDYETGSLLSAGVTSIVSKDADGVTLDTYAIPAAVQALTGYGWSAGQAYNYVDFAGKKFVQAVGSRAHASGDEADPTVITDGTTTYYQLAEPLETDISAYLTDDIMMSVESGGTLSFPNANGDDYRIPVPSKVKYMRRGTDN